MRIHCFYDVEGETPTAERLASTRPMTSAWPFGGMARGVELAGLELPRLLAGPVPVELALGQTDVPLPRIQTAAASLIGVAFGGAALLLSVATECTLASSILLRRHLWLAPDRIRLSSSDGEVDLADFVRSFAVLEGREDLRPGDRHRGR